MVSTGSLGAGPRSCAADGAASAGSKSPASEMTGSAVVVVPYVPGYAVQLVPLVSDVAVIVRPWWAGCTPHPTGCRVQERP